MTIKQIAEKILDRKITDNDGLNIAEIAKIEQKLQIIIPTELKEFYLTLGNNPLFTEAHQRFLYLDELVIRNNKLVFLEENQGACYWAVDLADNKSTYQASYVNFKECYQEEFTLVKFLEMLLYFQCVMADDYLHKKAKSDFQYFSSLDINDCKEKEKPLLQELQANFENVLKGNGISIFYKQDSIFLIFLDENGNMEQLFTCCKDEQYFEYLIDEYYFMQL